MKLYSTVAKEASAEQTIEKSRFITYVRPVSTREEADAFIAEIKKKHKDATHNVPAMVIGEGFQIQWASDDGEPQGTSGAPIVQMLVQEGITNVAVVVTRYFGGIKLGTGGLVRAYTSSAKLGLEAAGIREVKEIKVVTYRLDYGIFNKVQNFTFEQDVSIENIEYTDVVKFDLLTEPELSDAVKCTITGLANGREKIIDEKIEKF
ncbi:MAG: YigZ family protein [Firmicutes bacterium]|nr:YigZ family protein [Bacillota bacterium]